MSIIGLDIGQDHFRAVELDKLKGNPTLIKFGLQNKNYDSLPFNADKETQMRFAREIREFIDASGFSSSEVALGLPESQVFVTVIQVPRMSDKDLASSIAFEAEQYIPIPMDQVSLSYQKIESLDPKVDSLSVMLVAAKKDVLEMYISVLRSAGLTPKVLEPETLSIARSLVNPSDLHQVHVVMNIGFNATLVAITAGVDVHFTRSIPIGGDTFTKMIQRELGLNYQQADEYKKVYGMEEDQVDGKIFHVMRPVVDQLVAEIKRSTIFFTSRNPSVTIDKILISGGTALMPGLLFYLSSNLDIEVEVANPWKNIYLSKGIEDYKSDLLFKGPLFSISLGLGLKGL